MDDNFLEVTNENIIRGDKMGDQNTPNNLDKNTEYHPEYHDNKRKMAWGSFYCISIFAFMILILGVLSDPMSVRIEKLTTILIALSGTWGLIIATYMGVSAYTIGKGASVIKTTTEK